jgi:voltage-gated potassium channel
MVTARDSAAQERTGGHGPLSRLASGVGSIYRALAKENLPWLLAIAAAVMVLGAVVVFLFERDANAGEFGDWFDSLWWAVVTYTTVGYGDRAPITTGGRLFTITLMLGSLLLTAVVSGTIASVFVDRKLREGRGLQDISAIGHIVVCGWSRRAEGIIAGLSRLLEERGVRRGAPEVVLVNEMDAEDVQELSARFKGLNIRFVRGDFTNERVLMRAAIATAQSAILVSDESGHNTLDNADERVVLTALAINAISDSISISAELLNTENEPHLRRAHVEDIIVAGEFNGYLHATATFAAGVPLLVKELLTVGSGHELQQQPLPAEFVGRTFAELHDHFLHREQEALIGLLSQEKQMSLDDMLSEGTSSIDEFIKRKFAEAEIGPLEDQKAASQLVLTPSADYVVRDTDWAFVIVRAE